VSVNVSPSCIRDVNFPNDIQAMLQEAGGTGSWLEIELTEAAVVSSPERAIDCVRRLVDLGVQVSIDDFGTGYASVAKLSPQLLARIKIDKPYVSEVASNENTTRIVRSAIELGHSLGLKVVAEGVESEQVLERLREFGCDQVQGNVLSAPVPASKLVDWLRQLPAHSRSAPSLQVVATDSRTS